MDEPPAPRLAEFGELSEILALTDRCFNRTRGEIGTQWSHCYDPEQPERHAVLYEDDELVSHAACVENTLVVGEARLPYWGLSGVATDPRYRGQGHMTRLVEFWLDRMDGRDVPLATLGGDRQRYGRFGWELVGSQRSYRVTDRSLDAEPPSEEYVERFDGSKNAVEFVLDLYRTQPLRVERDAEALQTRFGRSHLETVLYTEPGSEAYLTFTRGGREARVVEINGAEAGVRALLAHVFDAYAKSTLNCGLHPSDPLNSFFGRPDVSASYRTRPQRFLNIRDLPTVLKVFENRLEQQWREKQSPDAAGELTLGIEGDDDAARISWDDGVTVERISGEPDLELDRRDAARVVFGPAETVDPGNRFLEMVTPVPFAIPMPDRV